LAIKSINSLNETIYFQRLSVIVSDIPYLIVLFLVIGKVNLKLVISYLSISFIILDSKSIKKLRYTFSI